MSPTPRLGSPSSWGLRRFGVRLGLGRVPVGRGPCVPRGVPSTPGGAARGGSPGMCGPHFSHCVPSTPGGQQGGSPGIWGPHVPHRVLLTPGGFPGVPMCRAVSPLPGVQHGGVPRDVGSPRATLSPPGMPRGGGQRGAHPQPAAGGEAQSLREAGPGGAPRVRYGAKPPPQPPRQCPRAVALSPAPAQASLCPRQGPCAAASAGGGRRG